MCDYAGNYDIRLDCSITTRHRWQAEDVRLQKKKPGEGEEPVFLWPQVAGIMVRPHSVWFYFLVISFFISIFLHPGLPSLTLTQMTNFEIWWISNSTWFPNVYLHQQSKAPSILVLAGIHTSILSLRVPPCSNECHPLLMDCSATRQVETFLDGDWNQAAFIKELYLRITLTKWYFIPGYNQTHNR